MHFLLQKQNTVGLVLLANKFQRSAVTVKTLAK